MICEEQKKQGGGGGRGASMSWDGNWVDGLIIVEAGFGRVGFFSFYICGEHASTQL